MRALYLAVTRYKIGMCGCCEKQTANNGHGRIRGTNNLRAVDVCIDCARWCSINAAFGIVCRRPAARRRQVPWEYIYSVY